MTPSAVLLLVESQADPRAVVNWAKTNPDSALRSVGVGLTQLRKLAKKVGRDAALAADLWRSDIYELRVIALLIDDPKTLTVEQAERQVDQLKDGQLAHVFASCDATLAKSPLAVGLAETWTRHADPMRRDCGHGLVYELSKSKKRSAPDDAWFLERLAHIDATWRDEGVDVRMGMATALMGMGKRSAELWPEALRIARDIGPIDFDPTGGCDPMDVAKHIDNPRVRAKLGVGD
ncbi:MAG: 3-methyladenine DNA glycosylase AlkD [Myxococcota bacterium]|jgi:3-methyladenine DNA glycosylase AlkD